MTKCALCGKHYGREVHVRAGLLYQPFRGPLSLYVCDNCMKERVCPGGCNNGYFRGEGGNGGNERRPCHVCGGTGSFDYADL